ncbi:MAG: ribonuclease P protein component [Bacteroidota bacterium]
MSGGGENRPRFTLRKQEILREKRAFDALFARPVYINCGAIRIFYARPSEEITLGSHLSVAFSVPKRKIKSAATRNLIKRRMREAYRHHKQPLINILEDKNERLMLLILFNRRQPATYQELETSLSKGLQELANKLSHG